MDLLNQHIDFIYIFTENFVLFNGFCFELSFKNDLFIRFCSPFLLGPEKAAQIISFYQTNESKQITINWPNETKSSPEKMNRKF